jgi:hypothetical protein
MTPKKQMKKTERAVTAGKRRKKFLTQCLLLNFKYGYAVEIWSHC